MISINKYGQTLDFSKVVEVNGKKTFSLDGLVLDKSLIIEVPKGTKFSTSLQEDDLKIEFKDSDGKVFELILKNMANLLAQNDGTQLVEIIQADDNKVLSSITDITSALEAAAAGPAGPAANTNSDSAANPGLNNDDGLNLQNVIYDNARILENLQNTGPDAVLLRANSEPIIGAIAAQNVDEDNTLIITFAANDIDNDTLTSIATATNGIVTILDGVITYVPNANFNGSDTIILTVNDGTVDVVKTIAVTVNPVNDAPTVEVNSTLTVDEDGTKTIVFTTNDIDNDTLTSIATATNGIVTILDGVITYVPNANFNGSDTIILTVNDGTVDVVKTIAVTVNPVNDAPIVEVAPEKIVLSENDFLNLSGTINAYHIITEAAMFELMGVQDVDSNELSLSLVTDSSNFKLNGDDVTSSVNGVIQLTQDDIDAFGLVGKANVGDFFIYSTEFDSLNKTDDVKVTFKVKAFDGIDYSENSVITLKVNGVNDAPIVEVAPEKIVLSENDFLNLSGTINAYHIITEAAMFELMGVQDVDSNELSLSLVTDSSNFKLNGDDVTSSVNGVIQLTQDDIDAFGLVGKANVGDFFIYSTEFDSLNKTDDVKVTFKVKAFDGIDYSENSVITLKVNGVNDAPIVEVAPEKIVLSENDFLNLSGTINAYHIITEAAMFELMGVQDVDSNELSLSLVTDSSNFKLNGDDVTSSVNGVIQLTQDDIDAFGLVGKANVGDFFIYSTEFDSLNKTDDVKVTFKVKAFDGIDYSENSVITLKVNGVNDAPIVEVAPEKIVLSENDFLNLSGTINAYHIITEAAMFELMGVQDVDSNELSLSLVTDSSNFKLNGDDVTSSVNGVIQLTQDDIDAFGLVGKANVGDFFIYSTEFDSLNKTDDVKVTFKVKAFDGIDYSENSVITLKVNGVNDAPIVEVAPEKIVLSENDFLNLSGTINAYHIITEAAMFELMGVQDVDSNELSLSLVTDSSNFKLNGDDVTSSVNGVIQLTQDDIDAFGLVGKANVGDFFIYSTEFDSLNKTDDVKVTFKVKAFDGIDYSENSVITLKVNGVNDAPIVEVAPEKIVLSENDFLNLSGTINAYHIITEAAMFELMGVQDVDSNELSLSLVTDSSNFKLNGDDVTSSVNGVIQLTQDDIDAFGLVGKANVGDFFIYSTEFDSLNKTDDVKVTFKVKAFDGIDYSENSVITLKVNGVNDAPIVEVAPEKIVLSENDFLNLSGTINAYHIITEAAMFELMGVQDVDSNELSLSLVTDSSNFKLNGDDVTSSVNGVIQLTQDDIDAFGLVGKANVGDFFIYSTEFDSLNKTDDVKVTFKVKAFDGIDYSENSVITLKVNGVNDAPIVEVAPEKIVLSENDFLNLSGTINAYHIITEAAMFELMGVQDVDSNELSLSLVTDSSNFKLNGDDVTSSVNGVIQLTQDDIDAFGLVGKANVGDFFIYSTEFDSLNKTDDVKVTFKVKAFDGIDYSENSVITLKVNGVNDAPIVEVAPEKIVLSENDFLNLSGTINAYHIITEAAMFELMGVQDVDSNELSLSLVTDSSNFKLNGDDVTSSVNGVIQLTQDDIDAFGLVGKANVGDFFIYSTEFDSLNKTDDVKVTFKVKAFDGIDYSENSVITLKVNGVNDAPVIMVTTEVDGTYVNTAIPNTYNSSIIVADINAKDVDNDILTYSIVVNSLDDSQYLSINSTTGIVTFTNEAAYNTANHSALNFQVKVSDLNGGEAVYSIQSGTGIDGYIVNMTVFSDLDGNKNLDLGEANDLTNNKGEFTLSGTDLSGTIIGYGGIDISTGLDFEGIYKALAGSSALNPITTLLVNLMNEGNSLTDAKTIIKDDFGISTNVDLQADPISEALSPTATVTQQTDYVTLQMLSTKIDNTIGQIAAAISGANITDERNAFDVVSQELAKLLNTGLVNLDNDIFINTLITNSLTALNGTLDTTMINDLVDVILNINTAISEAITSSITPLESFESLAKVQIAAETIENELEAGVAAGDTSSVVASSSGTTFAAKVAVAEAGLISKEEASINYAPIVKDVLIERIEDQLDNTSKNNTTLTVEVDSNIALSNFTSDLNVLDTHTFERSGTKLGLTILNTTPGLLDAVVNDQIDYIKEIALKLISIPEIAVVLSSITDVNMLMLINQLKNASSVPQLFTIINAINGVNVGIDSSTGALKLEIVDAKILETANLLNIEVNDNGSYSIESSLFNNLGKADTINLSFDYIAKDSTELVSEPKTLTLSIAGSNDALIIQDVVVATVKENTLDNTTLLIDIDSPYALSNFTSDIDITDYFYFERANDKLGLTILNTDPELLLALQSNNLAYIKNIAVELISIPEIAVVLNSITDVNMLMLINQLKNASSVTQLFTIINAINGINVGIDSSTGALKLEIVDAKILETANLLKIDIDGSGSYTVESALFNNMSIRDSISLSFEYNGTDSGGATTSPKTITVNIAGSNDAPTANISSTIVSKESPSYVGHLVASDVDANDVLTYTYDNTSVSMTLSVTGLNNLDSLVALNNPLAIQALTELKTVGLTFVNTGNVLALTTLSSSTIVAAKVAVSTLQDFLDSNSGLKNDIVALKDFISANKASIIANTALVAQDIVLLETLLTPSNITALGNLFNTLETFVSDPVAQAIVKNILADNVVSPTELALLAPIAPQIQLLRTEIVTLLAANPAIIGLLDIPTIISKLQEVVDVDTVKGEITATVEVPSSIAEMMINLDENTGEYTVTNPYLVSLPDATQVEVNFNYTVTDSAGDTDTSTAAMLITTAEVNEMNVSINDNNVLIIEEDHDIDMASLLLNATSNLNVADIDSIDLSNSEHILSNITKADFEAMVSDDSSNTLSITGENDDIVKLDLSIWTKNESDTDLNSIVDNNDDHFIAYTTLGTHDQVLTLLIDKDITVENI